MARKKAKRKSKSKTKKKSSVSKMSQSTNSCASCSACINPMTLGIAGGILWGLGLSLMTLVNIMTGYGDFFLQMVQSIYPGYHASMMGIIVALVYGFIDVFVGFYLLAWLYNKMSNAHSCSC